MSDNYFYKDAQPFYQDFNLDSQTEISADTTSSKKSDAPKRIFFLKVLLILLAFIIFVELVLYTIIIPCTAPVQISFFGLKKLNQEQLFKQTNIPLDQTWILFDMSEVSARLSYNPLIESVKIDKRFPDQVIITVVEREAVAVALTNINNKTVPVQIDKTGTVFAIDKGTPEQNVPLISGLTFENPREGMKLHVKLRPLMEQLSAIQHSNPIYLSAISEIRVIPKDYGNYELELYPVHSKIKVLMDRSLTEESLQFMMIALDVLDTLETSVSEVDLRYGSVSYKVGSSVYKGLSKNLNY